MEEFLLLRTLADMNVGTAVILACAVIALIIGALLFAD